MDYFIFIGSIAFLLSGFGNPTNLDTHNNLTKSVKAPVVSIYKPIIMSNTIEFESWSKTIQVSRLSK